MLISKNSPFYVKLAFKFLVIFFICLFISVSQNILVPFAFAVLLAVMLLPLSSFFENKGFSKVLSITMALLSTVLFLGVIIYLLSTQIANFVDDIPSIKKHLNDHFISIQRWIKAKLHISFTEQNEYLNNAAEKLKNNGNHGGIHNGSGKLFVL